MTVNKHVERRDPSLYFIRTICLDLAFQISITFSLFCKIILKNKINLKFNPHECSSKFNNLEYIYGKQKRQTLICRHQQIHKLFIGKLETLIPVRTIEGRKKKKKRWDFGWEIKWFFNLNKIPNRFSTKRNDQAKANHHLKKFNSINKTWIKSNPAVNKEAAHNVLEAVRRRSEHFYELEDDTTGKTKGQLRSSNGSPLRQDIFQAAVVVVVIPYYYYYDYYFKT